MMATRFDRAAVALGVGALACSVFAIARGSGGKVDFVQLRNAGLIVLLILGAIAVLGGLIGNRFVVIVAGAGFAVAGVMQLVQWGGPTNWLAGDGTTVSLFGGLGIGLLAVGLTPREASS